MTNAMLFLSSLIFTIGYLGVALAVANWLLGGCLALNLLAQAGGVVLIGLLILAATIIRIRKEANHG